MTGDEEQGFRAGISTTDRDRLCWFHLSRSDVRAAMLLLRRHTVCCITREKLADTTFPWVFRHSWAFVCVCCPSGTTAIIWLAIVLMSSPIDSLKRYPVVAELLRMPTHQTNVCWDVWEQKSSFFAAKVNSKLESHGSHLTVSMPGTSVRMEIHCEAVPTNYSMPCLKWCVTRCICW